MENKSAIITGITGQDGSYLGELLIEKGYKVYGIKRRTSTNTTERIREVEIDPNFTLLEGDICDPSSIHEIVNKVKPTEFYNLAAQSHVKTSFEQPSYTFQANAVGVLNCLESIRLFSPTTRFYQASTSEMFGSNFTPVINLGLDFKNGKLVSKDTTERIQNERTPFHPRSPYAVAKVAAHNLVANYRESYGIHGSCGILFNHESPRRGENFVTRKITKWLGDFAKSLKENGEYRGRSKLPLQVKVNDIVKDLQDHGSPFCNKASMLRLGNIKAFRDWGHARDYVEGMWLMLQQEQPDDYVLATGETHSVEEFLELAFSYMGLPDWKDYVIIDQANFRPAEVEYLLGDATKAKEKLGWVPKTSFKQLVKEMVEADYYGKEKTK